ncbi:MAG: TolC family protein [Calditrichaeota bacterium]|nr:TolC family protein [Calditrichota bacterium]
MHLHIRTVGALVGLLFLGAIAAAASHRLDWNDAWQRTLEQNRSLLRSHEEVTKARQRVREAYGAAMPSLSAVGLYTRNIESPVFYMGITDTTGRVNTMAIQIGLENSYRGMIELQQPIYVAGKIGLALRIAKSYLELSKTMDRQALQDLRLGLAQCYFGTMLAEELVRVQRQALEQARKHRDLTQLLFEQGTISEYDKIRAEVGAANWEPAVLEAENAHRQALLQLQLLLGLSAEDSIELVGTFEADRTPPEPLEQAIERALSKRPEVQAVMHQRAMQHRLLTIEKRSLYWPSLYGSASVTWQTEASDWKFEDYEWTRSAAAGITLSLPLFNGFATPARIQQVQSDLRSLDYQEMDLRQAVRNEVEGAHNELNRALKALEVQEKNLAQAEKGYEIAQVRYESGLSTQLELLDAELQVNLARVNRLRALYDLTIARFALSRAVGDFPRSALEP